MLGTGPTHCGPPHCTSRTHEQCHTHVYTHVRAFKHIILSMHSKHHMRPYNTGVHIPKAHNDSCPCTSIRMWPSDDTSSQLKLSRSSEKAFAVTRSAAAAHESDSLGARRASRRGSFASRGPPDGRPRSPRAAGSRGRTSRALGACRKQASQKSMVRLRESDVSQTGMNVRWRPSKGARGRCGWPKNRAKSID